VTAISEITGMEGEVITMQDIFSFERAGIGEGGRVRGRFKATGIRPKCAERLASAGVQLAAEMFEHVKVIN
jgi:pilus assembly protein CpaF